MYKISYFEFDKLKLLIIITVAHTDRGKDTYTIVTKIKVIKLENTLDSHDMVSPKLSTTETKNFRP